MIEGHLTVKDTVEKWELIIRDPRILCAEGKLEGATKFRGMWVAQRGRWCRRKC